jgi:hypothetical protein
MQGKNRRKKEKNPRVRSTLKYIQFISDPLKLAVLRRKCVEKGPQRSMEEPVPCHFLDTRANADKEKAVLV